MKWRVFLVAEGISDRRRLGLLLEWYGKKYGDQFEFIRPPQTSEDYLANKNIPHCARYLGFTSSISGHGGRGHGDRANLRLLFQILIKQRLKGQNDLIVLWSRDTDGDNDRAVAAREIREINASGFSRVSLAMANECGETWVLAGWRAETKEEHDNLDKWRKKLGFDPTQQPEALSHKEHAPKSAKEVMDDLVENEAQALFVAAENGRGVGCGLAGWIKEFSQLCTQKDSEPTQTA